jgi:predicted nucleic acid-binding protein
MARTSGVPDAALPATSLVIAGQFHRVDALYVALAESLGLPLLADDQKYAEAAGHAAVIEAWQ